MVKSATKTAERAKLLCSGIAGPHWSHKKSRHVMTTRSCQVYLSSRQSYKFDMYQLTNDNARDRKNVQHPLVDRVIPEQKPFRQLRKSQDYTYSLFLDITIRIPPRPTSRNRIWNPQKSFPTSHHLGVSRRKQAELGRNHTDYDKHSERLQVWVFNLWQEIWWQGERREPLL